MALHKLFNCVSRGCYPHFNAKLISWFFIVFGLLYIVIGIVLMLENNKLILIEIDYTKSLCVPDKSSGFINCQQYILENPGEQCPCDIYFDLSVSIPKQVYIYYELSNFYQNHRQYTESQDHIQQLGIQLDSIEISKKCEPFAVRLNKAVSPCGAIANSIYNDSIQLFYNIGNDSINVPLRRTGIAWITEKGRKFINPPSFSKNNSDAFSDTINPTNWQKTIFELDMKDIKNNGFQNEDLIVWMKVAPFPKFRKLFRIVGDEGIFIEGLPKGSYMLRILYAFPTWHFDGSKKIIIGNVNWFGGKNAFLGTISFLMGLIMNAAAICFLYYFKKKQ